MTRTSTVTILFCDLVDSTARATRLGDAVATRFFTEFHDACDRTITAHTGRVVKGLGDGVMAVFDASVVSALDAAQELHQTVRGLDDRDPPVIRVGVSVGEVSVTSDDYFGTAVVEAARLCNSAPPGGTYASEVVRSIAGPMSHLRFRRIGDQRLKGLSSTVSVVQLLGAPGRGTFDVDDTVVRSGALERVATLVVDESVHLLDHPVTTIGRRPDRDIVLDDPGASRCHAEVRHGTYGFLLADCGSANGTNVNGMPVTEHVLADGDLISIGDTNIVFRLAFSEI